MQCNQRLVVDGKVFFECLKCARWRSSHCAELQLLLVALLAMLPEVGTWGNFRYHPEYHWFEKHHSRIKQASKCGVSKYEPGQYCFSGYPGAVN